MYFSTDMGKITGEDSVVQQIYVDYIAPEQPNFIHQVVVGLCVALLAMLAAWGCKKNIQKVR